MARALEGPRACSRRSRSCLFVAQIVSGARNVWTRLRPWAVVLHVALSGPDLGDARGARHRLAAAGRQAASLGEPTGDPSGDADPAPARLAARHDHGLRPPHEAARSSCCCSSRPCRPCSLPRSGVPSLWLILATLVGGTIAAGSANAINMYLDRDIDEIMRRTRPARSPRTPSRPIAPCGSGSCWAPSRSSSCRSR